MARSLRSSGPSQKAGFADLFAIITAEVDVGALPRAIIAVGVALLDDANGRT